MVVVLVEYVPISNLCLHYLINDNRRNVNNSRVAYREDRSFCDTSMKIGTDYLHMILIKKSVCSQFENQIWLPKSKMAAKIYV